MLATLRFASSHRLAAMPIVLVVGGTLTASCTSEYKTPSTECSNAPRWPRTTMFEIEQNGPTNAPACTPHCGPNKPASDLWVGAHGALTSDALPSGACSEDGVVCTMSAEWLGPCPEEAPNAVGPLDLFICRCSAGSWACTVSTWSQSGTQQSCYRNDGRSYPDEDAGNDASSALDGGV